MAGTEHVISVEELLSRKVNVVRTEAGETSRGRRSLVIEERTSPGSKLKKEKFEKLRNAGANIRRNQAEKATPKIQQVPFLLRDHKNFLKYFEPRMVSLGPIHHGKEKYQPAEEYKLGLANNFVEDSGTTAEILYGKIEENIKQLRQCFDEKVAKAYDDEALAWMLFVDGCAVLQSINCAVHDKFKELKIKNDQIAFGQQDLFLLENQLPYQLLVYLMDSSRKKDELSGSIKSFIDYHNMARKMVQDGKDEGTTNPVVKDVKDKGTTYPPIHLLDLLRTRLLGNSESEESNSLQGQSYRNVQELKAAGIHVKRGNTNFLKSISFTKVFNFYPGHLYLPQIRVDDSTGPKFFNLIAYEMCPDFDNDFGVSSYVSFLDSLIDHPSDVKELRDEGILQNLLGSDKEVAKLFNEIGTDLVPDPNAYGKVKMGIQNYYDTKWKASIAQVMHDHFSSPWTLLALLAAIFVLGLTAIQTWYSAKDDKAGSSRPPARH